MDGHWAVPVLPTAFPGINEIQGLLKWTEVLLKLRSSPMESSLDTT